MKYLLIYFILCSLDTGRCYHNIFARTSIRSTKFAYSLFSRTKMATDSDTFTIFVVFGATGDLARKKIFPALFKASRYKFSNSIVIGCGRKPLTSSTFQDEIVDNFRKITVGEENTLEEFFNRMRYMSIDYSKVEDFMAIRNIIFNEISEMNGVFCRCVFYLAVPPTVFPGVICNLINSALINNASYDCDHYVFEGKSFIKSDILIEKPVGRDMDSFESLLSTLRPYLSSSSIGADHLLYDEALKCAGDQSQGRGNFFKQTRIWFVDHYLCKSLVKAILPFRYNSSLFLPFWNRHYIDKIDIRFKERAVLTSRSGYFDDFGIIRDVVQNHLLQVLSLITMELPLVPKFDIYSGVLLCTEKILEAKLNLFKQIRAVAVKDTVFGQYNGYTQEEGVREDSKTVTYSQCTLYIENENWRDVPVVLAAGKGLDENVVEAVIHFKPNTAVETILYSVETRLKENGVEYILDSSVQQVGEGEEPLGHIGSQLTFRVQPDQVGPEFLELIG